ncbi:cupin domain-containing protein [Nocardioides coralli]|uniref:cupin domain-containing protein n=1 Tax=Nocardioides coralli TaxID=2872154 RepID=UPI001CA3D348|nr:cupin domain-containing protein [Nocardioides coralli]QZY30652.1 cupin domain-containing protein [Nocardioides coralli]
MDRTVVVRPDEGRLLDLGNFEARVIVDGPETEGAFSLIQTRREPPGFGPPLHRHQDAAEAFYVLEGTYQVFADDQQHECPPGTFVYVPRAAPHTFQVVSSTPGVKLNLFAPAAMVGFFAELSIAEATGRATPELLDRIAHDNRMEVLGPVPDSYL